MVFSLVTCYLLCIILLSARNLKDAEVSVHFPHICVVLHNHSIKPK